LINFRASDFAIYVESIFARAKIKTVKKEEGKRDHRDHPQCAISREKRYLFTLRCAGGALDSPLFMPQVNFHAPEIDERAFGAFSQRPISDSCVVIKDTQFPLCRTHLFGAIEGENIFTGRIFREFWPK